MGAIVADHPREYQLMLCLERGHPVMSTSGHFMITRWPILAVFVAALAAAGCVDPFTPSHEYKLREAARSLPDKICVKGSMHLDCWSFSWEDCMQTAHEVVMDVVLDHKKHPADNRLAPGETLEEVLLEESRNLYGLRRVGFGKMFNKSERCLNPDNWSK